MGAWIWLGLWKETEAGSNHPYPFLRILLLLARIDYIIDYWEFIHLPSNPSIHPSSGIVHRSTHYTRLPVAVNSIYFYTDEGTCCCADLFFGSCKCHPKLQVSTGTSIERKVSRTHAMNWKGKFQRTSTHWQGTTVGWDRRYLLNNLFPAVLPLTVVPSQDRPIQSHCHQSRDDFSVKSAAWLPE